MPEHDQEVEVTESEESGEESVSPEEMDDAALDKYLEGDTEEEVASAPEEDAGETEADTPEESEGGEETPPESDPLELLKEQVRVLSKRVEDKERFIQNRNQEIGDLRKRLRAEAQALREEIPDLMIEDPVAGVERVLQARDREEQAARMEATEIFEANKVAVSEFCPNFEDRIDEVAAIAKSDGVPPEMIRAFRNNPYATSPKLIRMLLSRADGAKEQESLRAALAKEKAERESVASRIAKAAAQTRVTGKTPAAPGGEGGRFKDLRETDIGELSDAELDAFLSQEG